MAPVIPPQHLVNALASIMNTRPKSRATTEDLTRPFTMVWNHCPRSLEYALGPPLENSNCPNYCRTSSTVCFLDFVLSVSATLSASRRVRHLSIVAPSINPSRISKGACPVPR